MEMTETVEQIDNLKENNSESDGNVADQVTPLQVGSQEGKAEGEISDWTKDKRYQKMWKDPNDLYKSYRNMEKTYTPVKTRLESMDKLAKQYGVSVDKIEDVLKEYQSFKDPNAPLNQWNSYLSKWLQDSERAPDVVKFFEKMEQEEKIKKFGNNLSPEQIASLEKAEKVSSEWEDRKKQDEYDAQVKELSGQVEAGMEQIGEIATKYDIKWDEATNAEFRKYCVDNGIHPKYMVAEFSRLALSAVHEATAKKTSDETIRNIDKSKKAGVVVKTPKQQKTELSGDFRSEISKSLGFN